MAKKTLKDLQQVLIDAISLADIWTFFLDHFGEDSKFHDRGVSMRNPHIELILQQIGAHLFKSEMIVLADMRFRYLEDEQFVHGGFIINGCIGGVLYFESIRKGIAVILDAPPKHETQYARFTGIPVSELKKRGVPDPSTN